MNPPLCDAKTSKAKPQTSNNNAGSPSRAKVVILVANIKLAIGCIVAVFVYSEIIIPIADYSFALLLWTLLALGNSSQPWAAAMLLGVALTVSASAVQIMKIKPSESFNHNDLYATIFPHRIFVTHPGTTSSNCLASRSFTALAAQCALEQRSPTTGTSY